jgi:hypothetical protein
MVSKIKILEDKLYLMDEEFEGQTEKMRRQYDRRMWEEIERNTEKLKTDFQYKLEINMQEERSKMLKEQLQVLNQGSKKQGELAELKLKQTNIISANLELEKLLEQSEKELMNLRNLATKKNKWWPF